MTILVTGAAGFIGFHVVSSLLSQGESVIGVDNLNDYYDVSLKKARLDVLTKNDSFQFILSDINDTKNLLSSLAKHHTVNKIVHLAAQAGVRYSLENPFAYTNSNVNGHLSILEICRKINGLEPMVYASSSSVYGGNSQLPFSVLDKTVTPVSLYAATKIAGEAISHSYSHLYDIPLTGLRFFTVYGPWGRPDMALFIFTKAIIEGSPVHIFNQGNMRRDFTYIDDIVKGILAALNHSPEKIDNTAPHRIYNLGNNKTEPLLKLIKLIEESTNRKANCILEPMQPGDVPETFADIELSTKELGFKPLISLSEGVPRFVEWYRKYYGV